jgi:hypothetical protein
VIQSSSTRSGLTSRDVRSTLAATPELREGVTPTYPERINVMRTRAIVTIVAILAVIALAATWSLAAGPKQYQWTGTVTEVDAKAKTMSVDKGGDIWEFSTEGLKDLKVKKGDKVTVYYVTIARKVDAK